jgi:hypothetical protein
MSSPDTRLATPVQPLLRAWIVAEALFAVLAGRPTFLDPARAGLTDPAGFAWPIPVLAMAATLGVFYAASLPTMLWALTRKTWQELRVLAIPVAVFATLMTAMTFLHWDRFNHGSNPFRLWMVSYVLPPVVFLWAYWRQQRDAAPVGAGITHPFGAGNRAWLRANGCLLVAAAVVIWVSPALLVDHAPFKLTPLTARSVANVVLASGLFQLWMALEGDWRRVRVASLLLILVAVLLPVQLLRFPSGVAFGNPALVFLLADSAVTAILLVRTMTRG